MGRTKPKATTEAEGPSSEVPQKLEYSKSAPAAAKAQEQEPSEKPKAKEVSADCSWRLDRKITDAASPRQEAVQEEQTLEDKPSKLLEAADVSAECPQIQPVQRRPKLLLSAQAASQAAEITVQPEAVAAPADEPTVEGKPELPFTECGDGEATRPQTSHRWCTDANAPSRKEIGEVDHDVEDLAHAIMVSILAAVLRSVMNRFCGSNYTCTQISRSFTVLPILLLAYVSYKLWHFHKTHGKENYDEQFRALRREVLRLVPVYAKEGKRLASSGGKRGVTFARTAHGHIARSLSVVEKDINPQEIRIGHEVRARESFADKTGQEFYRAGDFGKIEDIREENGAMLVFIKWQRTGRSTGIKKKWWEKKLELLPATEDTDSPTEITKSKKKVTMKADCEKAGSWLSCCAQR